LLRVLLRHVPGERRAWQLLAEVAETPSEEQHARIQVGLIGAQQLQPVRRSYWPWIALLVLLVVAALIALLLWSQRDTSQAGQSSGAAGGAPAAPATTSTPTPLPVPPSPMPTPTTTPTPTPLPRPEVQALGTLLSYDGWHITLLQPDHAQMLSGSLGEVQARGRFALALLAVSNTTTTTRRLEPGVFALVDEQGHRYEPVAGASSAYLNIYGRGLRGDLAFEDQIPPTGGMFSVPLLFDVRPDVSELILTIGQDAEEGWPILTPTPAPVPDGAPAPTTNAGP
jgi:hypothetical protein